MPPSIGALAIAPANGSGDAVGVGVDAGVLLGELAADGAVTGADAEGDATAGPVVQADTRTSAASGRRIPQSSRVRRPCPRSPDTSVSGTEDPLAPAGGPSLLKIMRPMLTTAIPLWEIVLRTLVVYVTVAALLRVAGKRELGQMSVIDLVVILVIANAVQNSLNGGDNSLIGGLVSAATLVAINVAVDRVGRNVPFLDRFVRDEPTLLMQNGTLIKANLEHEGIEKDEIAMAAREHGIADLSSVDAAILEVDGSISVIPKEGGQVHRLRRIRQFRQRP